MNDPIPGNFQPTDEFAHNNYGVSLQQLYQQHPNWAQQWSTSSINPDNSPLALAQKAQQMQITANAPAIQTLQGQQSNLGSAYASLLQSVLGQGTVASNYAQKAENTLLGQRGITDNTSALFNQQMSQAILPVTAQNQSAASQIGLGSAQDLNQIAQAIASLQAGNVPQSLSFGQNIAGLQNSLQQAQINAAAQVAAAQAKPYTTLNSGQTLGNTQTGRITYPTFTQLAG